MKLQLKQFSHVPNFTRYMAIVEKIVLDIKKPGLEILDIPAGNGLLAERMRNHGNNVVCADINSELPDYVFANMEMPLPFESSYFDVVICLEGIEHVIGQYSLISELCRVCKPDGFVILSLPNIQSLFSRIKFLFTGTFYQFEPEGNRHPNGGLIDKGHISPITLVQLDYIFHELGFEPYIVTGDIIKKRIFFPLYMVLWFANVMTLWFRCRKCISEDVRRLYSFLTGIRPMTSRSLITVWRRS